MNCPFDPVWECFKILIELHTADPPNQMLLNVVVLQHMKVGSLELKIISVCWHTLQKDE